MSIKKMKKIAKKISIIDLKRSKKLKWIIGIDEVGRGPIAGPVTVCAFALKVEHGDAFAKMGFKDSKKISAQKREQFVQLLNNYAQLHMCTWAIENSSATVIDQKGIVPAIQSALDRCLKKLDLHPEDVDIYLDGGLHAPKSFFRQHTIIHGDDLFPVISCASILAKVYRDHLMQKFDLEYPEYGFIDNKGYGTQSHYKAVKKHGLTDIHRVSFLSSVL